MNDAKEDPHHASRISTPTPRAGGPFSTYSETGLAVRPPCRTRSGPPTPSCPGDPWGAARTLPLSPRCFPSEEPGGCWGSASVCPAPRGPTWIVHASGSGTLWTGHDLIETHQLQHDDNDDHRADQVHDRVHVTSLPSGWLAAFCVLMVPYHSGQVVPRLPGSCGVPAPDPIPAAPRTPVLSGVCKARSSPLAG
jgi:hypothetical protein